MFCSDYPRCFVNCFWLWWFPAPDPLPVTSALTVPLLLAVSRYLSWALKRDHFRAASRHLSLQ